MRCKVCDRLNVTELLKQAKAISDRNFLSDDYFYFEHYKRYDDLVTAALSGCELCLLLQRQCEDEKIEVYDQDSLVTLEQKFRILEANNRPMDLRVDIKASHLNNVQPFEKGKVFDHLTFQHWESDNTDFSLRIVFILQTSKDQPKFIDDTRIGQFIIDEDLASDANFDIARGWMNNYIVEHSESNCPSFEDKVLPSRVIDIGSEDTNPYLLRQTVLGANGSH
ncbi:hypothetical protein BOTNAR_0006g00750 [Botryotinia narcissicola]|uniref:Uncharacterized protein n=1 Tax=Botryotinia narcissicola TaxID=278944 RepID=A0A4Z1J8G5_9HELO|nr:hypothetical protein BOTNAR_0006g00750 [Botryotinia narcissicola]